MKMILLASNTPWWGWIFFILSIWPLLGLLMSMSPDHLPGEKDTRSWKRRFSDFFMNLKAFATAAIGIGLAVALLQQCSGSFLQGGAY